MRTLLVGLAFLVAAGCGGSSTSGGTGGSGGATGGSAGSGATGGGGSGATGGSPADASTDGGFSQCFDSKGNFIAGYDWTTCGGGDCSMVAHETDCCGSILLIGVASSHLKALQACEKAWRASLPACGCASNKISTQQPSSTVANQSMATVQCTDWTMQSGICLSEPK